MRHTHSPPPTVECHDGPLACTNMFTRVHTLAQARTRSSKSHASASTNSHTRALACSSMRSHERSCISVFLSLSAGAKGHS
eukprot:1127157-Pleurochrysis_carterae.AAC.1